MSNIKLWLLSVCVFSVIMSLFRILLPRGNVKKTAGTALSLIFLLFIISSAAKNGEEAFSQSDFSVFGDSVHLHLFGVFDKLRNDDRVFFRYVGGQFEESHQFVVVRTYVHGCSR